MMLFVYILVLLHSVVYVWAEACTNIIQPEFKGMHQRKSFNGTKTMTLFLRAYILQVVHGLECERSNQATTTPRTILQIGRNIYVHSTEPKWSSKQP